MLKTLAMTSLGVALACGSAGLASAQILMPRALNYYQMGPGYYFPPDQLYEGRSLYRPEDPSTFYNGSDEKGYPSGDPQNPPSSG